MAKVIQIFKGLLVVTVKYISGGPKKYLDKEDNILTIKEYLDRAMSDSLYRLAIEQYTEKMDVFWCHIMPRKLLAAPIGTISFINYLNKVDINLVKHDDCFKLYIIDLLEKYADFNKKQLSLSITIEG